MPAPGAANPGFCLRCGYLLAVLACVACGSAGAEPVRLRHPEGTLHGFLSLSTEQGQALAAGDLIQVVHGDRVTYHLVFHFKDGSLDDETAVFTQRGVFRLISDHHIQRGPYFPHPLDMSIDVRAGTVTTRSPGKDGKDDVATERMKLPTDLYNGMVTPVIANVSPDAGETRVSMVVPTPKPRLITLDILSQGEVTFALAGIPRRALSYHIKMELGGIAGVVAPVIGKQPPDLHMWLFGGDVPVFLRETGPIVAGGEVLTISLIGPTWPGEVHDRQ